MPATRHAVDRVEEEGRARTVVVAAEGDDGLIPRIPAHVLRFKSISNASCTVH